MVQELLRVGIFEATLYERVKDVRGAVVMTGSWGVLVRMQERLRRRDVIVYLKYSALGDCTPKNRARGASRNCFICPAPKLHMCTTCSCKCHARTLRQGRSHWYRRLSQSCKQIS